MAGEIEGFTRKPKITTAPEGFTKGTPAPVIPEPPPENGVPQKEENKRLFISREEGGILNDVIDASTGAIGPALPYLNEFLKDTAGWQGVKALASGVTAGFSEKVPGLETEPGIITTAGKIVGSIVPWSRVAKILSPAAGVIASKSPILKRQVQSLITMFGVGNVEEAVTSIREGELPSPTEMIKNGWKWATIDAFFQSLAASSLLAQALYRNSSRTGRNRKDIITDLYDQLMGRGVNMKNPGEVIEATGEILGEEGLMAGKEFTKAGREALRTEQALSRPFPQAPSRLPERNAPYPADREALMKERGMLSRPFGAGIEPVSPISIPLLALQRYLTPEDLKDRKISETEESKLAKEEFIPTEPYQPTQKDFTAEVNQISENQMNSDLEQYAPKARTEKDFGTNVQGFIEQNFDREEAAYRALYDKANKGEKNAEGKVISEGAENLLTWPKQIGKEAGDLLREFKRFKTNPSDYSATKTVLKTSLEDAGFKIQEAKNGDIEDIIFEADVEVDKLMGLARRLSDFANYESVVPNIKNVVKKIVNALKNDIRKALEKDPIALKNYNEAEKLYGETAEKFANKEMVSLRQSNKGEGVAKLVEGPTMLTNMRKVLTPNQMKQVERKVLDDMQEMSFEKAKKYYKEIHPSLSNDARKLGQEIIDRKNPYNPKLKNDLAKQDIIKQMSDALTTGTKPQNVIDLWHNPKGQKLIKDAFKGSPNWPEIKDYLERQFFNDTISSVIGETGHIDTKKFDKLMKNPLVINNIKSLGGEEAYEFFNKLTPLVDKIKNNSELLNKIPKFDLTTDKYIASSEKKLNEIAKYIEKVNADAAKEIPEIVRIAQENIQLERDIAKASSGVKGKQITQKLIDKQFKGRKEIEKWYTRLKNVMGIHAKTALTVFGAMKFGGLELAGGIVTYNLMKYLLTSPRFRNAFKKLGDTYKDPLAFILAVTRALDEYEREVKRKKEENKKLKQTKKI